MTDRARATAPDSGNQFGAPLRPACAERSGTSRNSGWARLLRSLERVERKVATQLARVGEHSVSFKRHKVPACLKLGHSLATEFSVQCDNWTVVVGANTSVPFQNHETDLFYMRQKVNNVISSSNQIADCRICFSVVYDYLLKNNSIMIEMFSRCFE